MLELDESHGGSVATEWWWKREAERLAAAGDYKAAYEARLQVPFQVVEVERDAYADELLERCMKLEARNQRLTDSLQASEAQLALHEEKT